MNEITEIKLDGKYVITCERPLTMVEVERIRSAWSEFINSKTNEVLVLTNGVKLLKIDPVETK